mmetsp:Transcript_16614/g.40869  ORF Transcript_16614/g.40869 Transcript_16614/m.40869 type:complete len:500 (-) Transcript_16614:1266-2765(-)
MYRAPFTLILLSDRLSRRRLLLWRSARPSSLHPPEPMRLELRSRSRSCTSVSPALDPSGSISTLARQLHPWSVMRFPLRSSASTGAPLSMRAMTATSVSYSDSCSARGSIPRDELEKSTSFIRSAFFHACSIATGKASLCVLSVCRLVFSFSALPSRVNARRGSSASGVSLLAAAHAGFPLMSKVSMVRCRRIADASASMPSGPMSALLRSRRCSEWLMRTYSDSISRSPDVSGAPSELNSFKAPSSMSPTGMGIAPLTVTYRSAVSLATGRISSLSTSASASVTSPASAVACRSYVRRVLRRMRASGYTARMTMVSSPTARFRCPTTICASGRVNRDPLSSTLCLYSRGACLPKNMESSVFPALWNSTSSAHMRRMWRTPSLTARRFWSSIMRKVRLTAATSFTRMPMRPGVHTRWSITNRASTSVPSDACFLPSSSMGATATCAPRRVSFFSSWSNPRSSACILSSSTRSTAGSSRPSILSLLTYHVVMKTGRAARQ